MNESDLFAVAEEIREERAAIAEHDGLLSREDAERLGLLEAERYREACEVRYVLTIHGSAARKAYLDACEKHRGKAAADKLRDAVRAEWNRRVQD